MVRSILATARELNAPVDPQDRFAYGWRYVTKVAKNGSETKVQVPLTLEDILHPQEEDFRVLSNAHREDAQYLCGAFEIALNKTPHAQVLSDCRVAWTRDGKYAHGPDVAAIFNVREKKDWGTFNVVKEKTKPALIIEITSPETRSTDLVNKVREYAEQGVPHYVIADAKKKDDSRQVTLIDYHLDKEGGAYYMLPVDDEGRVWLEEVNLWLSVDDGRLICTDAKGKRIGTAKEERQARNEAEQGRLAELEARMSAEKRAADAETRIKQLEEQMRRATGPKGRNGKSH